MISAFNQIDTVHRIRNTNGYKTLQIFGDKRKKTAQLRVRTGLRCDRTEGPYRHTFRSQSTTTDFFPLRLLLSAVGAVAVAVAVVVAAAVLVAAGRKFPSPSKGERHDTSLGSS
jgi:hypothetical protein